MRNHVIKLENKMAEREEKEIKEKSRTGPLQDEKLQIAVKRKAEDLSTDEGSPIKMKIAAPSRKGVTSGISIKVGQLKSVESKKEKADVILRPKKGSVAAAFNDESDEEEEIPKEAKMRMRNLGKDTATSSGPNSFNKGKQGFTNHNKVREKELKLVKP